MTVMPLSRGLVGLLVAGVSALGPLAATTPAATAYAPIAAGADGEATVCDGGTCTTTYASTGSVQTFTVPDGVTEVTVTLAGGSGGGQSVAGDNYSGGFGGQSTAAVPTAPGEVLSLVVAGAGSSSDLGPPSPGRPGGYGGGGSGGAGTPSDRVIAGPGGGGGSFLLDDTGALLLAAGGGGGGPFGGDGGAATDPATPASYGGGAASQDAHGNGAAGDGGGAGTAGSGRPTSPESLPLGGTGGAGGFGGGGGGGGYFAGGGGGGGGTYLNGGGGGGSGFADPSLTGVDGAAGANDGDGYATIAWSQPDPGLQISRNNVPRPALAGLSFVPTASSFSPGDVRFSLGSETTRGACRIRDDRVRLERPGRCQLVASQDAAAGWAADLDTATIRVVPADTEAFDVRLGSRQLATGRRQSIVVTGVFFESMTVTDSGRQVSPPGAQGDQAGRYRLTWKTTGPPGPHRVVVTGDPDYRVGRATYRLVRR